MGVMGWLGKLVGGQDVPIPDNPTPEDYSMALAQESPWQKMERMANMCGKGLINCPIP